ncbi:MAG: ATP-binding protein [Gammaproteobacteria bacterium]|nr:ATP-binding protein [Gammaproteobacteria bacterium]
MDIKPHILIVAPSNLKNRYIDFLSGQDYQFSTADSGEQAWQLLSDEPDKYDVILIDNDLSDIKAEVLIDKMQHHAELHSTVVLLTNTAEKLDIGAQYYINKPIEQETLISILIAAVRHQISYKHRVENKIALGLLRQAEFQLKTIHEAHALASYLSDICPDSQKVITGLTELMINAVEHGNLAIDYDEKNQLTKQGKLNQEIQRRQALPEYKDKYVNVSFQLTETVIEITIEDQGKGFDWQQYMEFDSERLLEPHGRGIAIANKLSFCEVEYTGGIGNKVVARIFI